MPVASRRDLPPEGPAGASAEATSRAARIPGPGFAAGPCLFKDTMQLAAFSRNQFALGHAAMGAFLRLLPL